MFSIQDFLSRISILVKQGCINLTRREKRKWCIPPTLRKESKKCLEQKSASWDKLIYSKAANRRFQRLLHYYYTVIQLLSIMSAVIVPSIFLLSYSQTPSFLVKMVTYTLLTMSTEHFSCVFCDLGASYCTISWVFFLLKYCL